MKFKLVESIDDRLVEDVLEEEKLDEKYWIKLEAPSAPHIKPFYYYTIDSTSRTRTKDLDALMQVIDGTNTGTFKQQLNQNILNELKSAYQAAKKSGIPFSLNIVSTSVNPKELEKNKKRVITLTDRTLRKIAQDDIELPNGLSKDEWLIHHKIKGEQRNKYDNIALISRNSGDEFAHAIHRMIEDMGPNITNLSVTVPIQEFDIASKAFTPTHYVDITIR